MSPHLARNDDFEYIYKHTHKESYSPTNDDDEIAKIFCYKIMI